jgi:DNA mismatch repair ATPase MutS
MRLREKVKKGLKQLPDIERLLSKIFTYSVKSKVQAIYIDMAVITRLNEFHALIKHFRKMSLFVEDCFSDSVVKKLNSKRLK